MTISGVLLDEDSRSAIAHADITLAFPINGRNAWERGNHPPALRARTDEGGRFNLTVSNEWNRRSVYACLARLGDATAVFSGYVSLQDELLLLGALPQIARGRLVSHHRFPYAKTSVQIASKDGVGSGSAVLDEAGLFEAVIPCVSRPSSFELWFSLLGVEGSVLARASRQSLFGEWPVEIECYPVKLTVVCVDESGAAVPMVTVRAGNLENEHFGLDEFQTDSTGQVTILVQPGDLEICLAKDGYWTSIESVQIERVMDSVHQMIVKEQRNECVVRGRVLRPDGSPVSRAFVSCVPTSRVDGVSLGNLSGAHTDDNGEFQLMSRFRGISEVRAFHRNHGFTRVSVVSEYPTFVTMIIGDLGSVTVDAVYAFSPVEYVSGWPEYYLMDRYKHRSFSGVSKLPITLADIPEGDYNLYVKFPEPAGYIETSLLIEAGREKKESAELVAGHWHAGQVISEKGESVSGAVVQAENPDWPEELARVWGMSTTDAEGRFEVFAGARECLTLKVTHEGRLLGTCQSSSSAMNRVVVNCSE